MKHGSRVSTVILNWNRKDYLLECIASVKAMDYPTTEIVVVDNASTDGSAAAVKATCPDVTVIENDKNYGAIGGKNIGLRYAINTAVDYIFMVDNDIVCSVDALSKLVSIADEDPDAGMVGSMMYDHSKPDIILSAGGIIDYTQNVSRGRGDGEKDIGRFQNVEEVDYLWGGALLVRKEVLAKVGLFDEKFVGYWFEDTDLSVRVHKAGYKVLFNPHSKVWHRPHAVIEQFSFRKKYLATRNAIRFMKKHANKRQWIKYLGYAIGGLPFAFIRDLVVCRDVRGVWGKAKGLFDGLFNRQRAIERVLNSNFKK
ncbi:glycosyltransferase family 2 protein [candidate division KSB1 bacterium]|nr:glycosyltransferase family 2 protein [candidate division KSB1 bacterium]